MKWLRRIEEAFLGVSIAVATLVLFVNIVLRYVFSANTNWTEEFIRYTMIWITFIGCSVCFRKGLHVGIDFFLEFVSKKWNAVIGIVVNIVSMVLMIFLVVYGTELVIFSMNTGQITPSLQIKMYWVYLGIPVGALLSLIHLFSKILNQFKSLKTKSYEEHQV